MNDEKLAHARSEKYPARMSGDSATQITQTERTWPRGETLSLDELSLMSVGELEGVYRAGSVPYSLEALNGELRGRVLTMVGPGGRAPLVDIIRAIEASDGFPWAGKTFTASSPIEGTGINRMRLPGGRQRNWFPFATSMARSAVDDEPCILLDYDNSHDADADANPWLIRKIRDELREVAPKLFLGPALLNTPTRPRLMAYFALQS